MNRRPICFFQLICLGVLLWPGRASAEDLLMEKAAPGSKAPSKEQVLWTATNLAYDLNVEQSYSGPASVGFGGGQEGKVRTTYTSIRQIITVRKYMALLLHGGLEWDRYGFVGPDALPVPGSFHAMTAPLAVDFRFSQKDMVRLQAAPGFYTDFEPVDMGDFNIPFSVGYGHVFSKRFQVGAGLSVNQWRHQKIMGGGGFRWQMTDRWTLKFLMPYPQIQYKAAPTLRFFVGSDFRGDTFRVGTHFGSDRGDPRLDSALVDYQEIRSGGGFSWNIRPLLELSVEAGMLLDREFNYHKHDVRSSSGKAPYASLSLRYLFQIHEDKRSIPQQMKALEDEYPWMRRSVRPNR